MRQRHVSFFLAVVLLTAAPAFADKITLDFEDADRNSASMHRLPHNNVLQGDSVAHNVGPGTFKENEFQFGFNSAVQTNDFTKDGEIPGLDALLNSGLGPDSRQVTLLNLASMHGDSFGTDDHKARWDNINRDRDDGDDHLFVIVAPEPGSRTLLLFGLAGLALIVCRRNAMKNVV